MQCIFFQLTSWMLLRIWHLSWSVISSMLCTSDAVARIGLVKPDKAKGVENIVLQMAQRGQLNEKVSLA